MAAELEPPFYPREKLIEKQKYFQSVHKHTYLKGRYDVITSVAIPLALAAASTYMIGKGIYNMSHGIGKKEWEPIRLVHTAQGWLCVCVCVFFVLFHLAAQKTDDAEELYFNCIWVPWKIDMQ